MYKGCYVIGVSNCVNLDVDFGFTPEEEKRYQGCIVNSYEYNVVDRETMVEGDSKLGKCYRARIKGMSPIKDKKSHSDYKRLMKEATFTINKWRTKTHGYFLCKVGDVDTFRRILVELYDPVTLECVNDTLLDNHSAILEPYRFGKY